MEPSQQPNTEAEPQNASSPQTSASRTNDQLESGLHWMTLLIIVAIPISFHIDTLYFVADASPKIPYEDAGLPQNFGADGNPDLQALSEVLKQCVMTPGQTMPKTLQELVDRKFIRQLPAPPAGQGYGIDSKNLVVQLVPAKNPIPRTGL